MRLTKSPQGIRTAAPTREKITPKNKALPNPKYRDTSMLTVKKIASELDLPVETLLLSGFPPCTFHDLLAQSEQVKKKIDAIKGNLTRLQKLLDAAEKMKG